VYVGISENSGSLEVAHGAVLFEESVELLVRRRLAVEELNELTFQNGILIFILDLYLVLSYVSLEQSSLLVLTVIL